MCCVVGYCEASAAMEPVQETGLRLTADNRSDIVPAIEAYQPRHLETDQGPGVNFPGLFVSV